MVFSMVFGYICFEFVLESMSVSAALRAQDHFLMAATEEQEIFGDMPLTPEQQHPHQSSRAKRGSEAKTSDNLARGKFLDYEHQAN